MSLDALRYPGSEVLSEANYQGVVHLLVCQSNDSWDQVRKWYGNKRRLGVGIGRSAMSRDLAPFYGLARQTFPPPEVYMAAGESYESPLSLDVITLCTVDTVLTVAISAGQDGLPTVILLQSISFASAKQE